MCTCKEMYFEDENTGKTVALPEDFNNHSCDYIEKRNSLIPDAQRYANNKMREAEKKGSRENFTKIYCERMDFLWKQLAKKEKKLYLSNLKR